MSYQISAANRQAILDCLHKNPMETCGQLFYRLEMTRNSLQSALKFMVDRGEVEKTGRGKATAYRAISVNTITAEQDILEMQAKRQAACTKKANHQHSSKNADRPGVIRHVGGNHPPLKNQGGQGAVRRVFGIQSCAEWV